MLFDQNRACSDVTEIDINKEVLTDLLHTLTCQNDAQEGTYAKNGALRWVGFCHQAKGWLICMITSNLYICYPTANDMKFDLTR